jgi:hypothetical protein
MSFSYPSLPSSLVSFYHNLSVSVQNFKIRVEGSDSAHPSDILSWVMPAALVNLDSIRLHYKVTTKQIANTAGTYCRLSSGADSPFTSVSCESGGTILDSLQSGWNRYNQLIRQNTRRPQDWRKVAQNEMSWSDIREHIYTDTVVPSTPGAANAPVVGVAVPAAPTLAAPWLNKEDEFVLEDWGACFIGTCAQRLFNANICPIRVLMRFEDFSRAFISDDITKFTAIYENIYLTMQTIQLNDGSVYADRVNNQLSSGASIDYKYQRIRSFSNGASTVDGTLVVGIPTSSLDGLISVFYHKDSLDSTKSFHLFNDADNTFPIPKNLYFTPSLGNLGNTVDTQQFSIQNVLFPTFPASQTDQWSFTRQSLREHDGDGCEPYINTMQNHRMLNGAMFYIKLDMPGVEKVIRLRSGLNMVGTTAVVSAESHGTTAAGGEVVKVLYAQTSPVLQVGLGRQVNIIS